MRSVVDQNVVIRRMTEPRTKDAFVQSSSTLTLTLLTYTFIHVHKLSHPFLSLTQQDV
jgi:hypothetical protein